MAKSLSIDFTLYHTFIHRHEAKDIEPNTGNTPYIFNELL